MVQLRSAIAFGFIMLGAASAHADAANHVVADYGSVSLPFTQSIGNTFWSVQAGVPSAGYTSGSSPVGGTPVTMTAITTQDANGISSTQSYFYDDYLFSLPTSPLATFSAAAITIDLSNVLSLQNFSARLYRIDNGLDSLTTGVPASGAVPQRWTSTSLVGQGISGEVTLINNVNLLAGARYALEIRGTVAGLAGGSYGGNINITPVQPSVPEPSSMALLLASLGVLAWVSRRRSR